MSWAYYIIPVVITSLTGWLIVLAGIKFIFHPRKAVKIPGLSIQGIFPAKQAQIAEQLGTFVGKNLFSFSEIEQKVINPENLEQLKPEIEQHIDFFLREKLKTTFPMLSAFIGEKTINQLKAAFLMELESLFPVLMKSYMGKLQQSINLEQTVTEKIKNFPVERLESIFNNSVKKMLLRLQLLGASIGFLMGLLQVLLMHAFR